jgi:hypothetical protein
MYHACYVKIRTLEQNHVSTNVYKDIIKLCHAELLHVIFNVHYYRLMSEL